MAGDSHILRLGVQDPRQGDRVVTDIGCLEVLWCGWSARSRPFGTQVQQTRLVLVRVLRKAAYTHSTDRDAVTLIAAGWLWHVLALVQACQPPHERPAAGTAESCALVAVDDLDGYRSHVVGHRHRSRREVDGIEPGERPSLPDGRRGHIARRWPCHELTSLAKTIRGSIQIADDIQRVRVSPPPGVVVGCVRSDCVAHAHCLDIGGEDPPAMTDRGVVVPVITHVRADGIDACAPQREVAPPCAPRALRGIAGPRGVGKV